MRVCITTHKKYSTLVNVGFTGGEWITVCSDVVKDILSESGIKLPTGDGMIIVDLTAKQWV